MQQKIRRRDKKLRSLKDILATLKNKRMLSEGSANILEDQFSGLSKEIFENQLKNSIKNKPQGRRYSDELKQFALTLNFYSHKAYNYMRKVFYLPHQSSIKQGRLHWSHAHINKP